MSARLALIFAVIPDAPPGAARKAAEELDLSDEDVVEFIRCFSEGRISRNSFGLHTSLRDPEACRVAVKVSAELNRLGKKLHDQMVVDELAEIMAEGYGRQPWSSPAPPEA
jgi:hypothetical protein